MDKKLNKIIFLFSLLIKDKIRERFFFVISISSIFFVIALFLSSKLFIGEKDKVFLDFGFSVVNFTGLLTSIYFSSEIINDLKKGKFLNWLLSLPLKKNDILLSCFMTVSFLTFFTMVLYSIIFFLFFIFLKIPLNYNFILYFIMNFLKFLTIISIGLIISINYEKFSTILFLLIILIIGNSMGLLLNFIKMNFHNTFSIIVVNFFYYIFPDFQISHLTMKVLHFKNINILVFVKSYIYYISYIFAILSFGLIWIEKKEFI